MSGADRPLRVYLDQNVFSQFPHAASGNWRDHEIARILLDAQKSGRAEIWASPTHVIETLQTPDPKLRQLLPLIILELTDARRMWRGHVFANLANFRLFVESMVPNFVRTCAFIREQSLVQRQFWLGALGLLGSGVGLNLEEAVQTLRHDKAANRLLHARFAAAPDEWIEKMIDAARNQRMTTDDPFSEFATMSVEQMETEVEALKGEVKRIGKKALERLQKNRALVASVYGAAEIGLMIRSVFHLPGTLEVTFDIPEVIRNWAAVQEKTKCPSLPKEIVDAPPEEQAADTKTVLEVLDRLAPRGRVTRASGPLY